MNIPKNNREFGEKYYNGNKSFRNCKNIRGLGNIKGIRVVNQKSVGRSSRSNPATYTGIYDDIRKFYTNLDQAKEVKLSASHFSFNTVGGRCETCKGTGNTITSMHFLPDIKITCPDCHGKRFKEEVLSVQYKKLNINDLLELTIEEALKIFDEGNRINRKLKLLTEVGVGYLQLGQEFSTLSGGEAQRIKLAKDLIDDDSRGYLYIFDEPSTGLHFSDSEKLIHLFQKIVEKGNSAVVIEHNPQFLGICDHLIEIGPESGIEGGNVVFEGTPMDLIKSKSTHTAQYLSTIIEREMLPQT